MFCPNCGAENDDDAMFCGNCGEPLDEFQEGADSENTRAQDTGAAGISGNTSGDMFCPNCGAPVDKNALFCGNCGEPINDTEDNGYFDDELDEAPKKGFLSSTVGKVTVGAIALCAIVGVAIAGVSIYRNSHSEPEEVVEEDETPGTEEAASADSTQGTQQAQVIQDTQGDQDTQGTQDTLGTQDTQQTQGVQITGGNTQGTVQAETDTAEYLVPDAATRYYTAEELAGLDKTQLRIARNEIYARHGRLFDDDELQQYFNSKSWYNGTIKPNDFNDDTMLNEYEKANIQTIKSLEG